MKRYEIISAFIKARGYKSYLEIGIENPINCFDKIECAEKVGIEPTSSWKNRHFNIAICTSDHYFKHIEEGKKFDIVFVDGLHVSEQVVRDIHNAFMHLNPNGVIVVHDVDCETEWMGRPQSEYKFGQAWKGDVWKGFFKSTQNLLSLHGSKLSVYTLMTVEGCGIIDFADNNYRPLADGYSEITWDEYNNRKAEILNPITLAQFTELLASFNPIPNDENETVVSDTELSTTGTDKKSRRRTKPADYTEST